MRSTFALVALLIFLACVEDAAVDVPVDPAVDDGFAAASLEAERLLARGGVDAGLECYREAATRYGPLSDAASHRESIAVIDRAVSAGAVHRARELCLIARFVHPAQAARFDDYAARLDERFRGEVIDIDDERDLLLGPRVTPALPGFRHVFRFEDRRWPDAYAFPADW